ncbi:hypothetical protein BN946_scf184783.g16 [Trametes cinnabarina]|uniref:Uncharacterized protein n=1 Tax=Pycnoporus cinnabarinus TaxID=5643 RepID=A0A060S6M0_PYCCI|nr:hypothetical protein BN946_scf184783.g16 [Trametes cinnabarina]
MHLTIATIVAALCVGATKASTLSLGILPHYTVDVIPGTFPIVDLQSAKGAPNVTLPRDGVQPDTTQADFPAILYLCAADRCVDCWGLDLATMPERECFNAGFSFVTAIISQPSNTGLSFEVFVAPPGCTPPGQLAQVNVCYFTYPTPFDSFYRT